jgi:hypothetical protein
VLKRVGIAAPVDTTGMPHGPPSRGALVELLASRPITNAQAKIAAQRTIAVRSSRPPMRAWYPPVRIGSRRSVRAWYRRVLILRVAKRKVFTMSGRRSV